MRLNIGLLGLLFIALINSAVAHNKVVVVPLGGDEFKPLKNIVTVAKANGDFTNIQAAIDSISNASATNPYVVVIGPGQYDVATTIVAKEYVDITGSGQGTTIISGSVRARGFDSPAVFLVANVRLSNLSVHNTSSGSSYSLGISVFNPSNFQDNITIENVTVRVGGAPINSSRGVYVEEGSVLIRNADVLIEGTTPNYGIRAYSGDIRIVDSRIEVNSGTVNRAVYSAAASSTVIDHSDLIASGTDARALYSKATVKYSTLTSTGLSIESIHSVKVHWSTLVGGVSGATIECAYSADDNGNELSAACD
ncbi:glycosyl hydrolase family 28-related protein [Arenicella xantha]|uniref:Pectate lyase-like protein n=1 Tax=Arenicella xantha TaxID=644221 RepID=A0A395JP59_9GAMM|nr:glycosyl hydrolase family 28-related protein [Arenicella xantha]RBP53123.1 pectate lyase-like protein [Arenicella xantha]